MQRLFTTFPGGAPGAALVLYRACVAAMLAADAGLRLPPAGAVLALGTALAVLAGAATPLACLLALGCEAAVAWSQPGLVAAVSALQALALAGLGPGAYSVDGLVFGRRRLMWPRS